MSKKDLIKTLQITAKRRGYIDRNFYKRHKNGHKEQDSDKVSRSEGLKRWGA